MSEKISLDSSDIYYIIFFISINIFFYKISLGNKVFTPSR